MKRRNSLLLIALVYLGFISLGLPDGLNGVAWPSIRAYFNLPIDALGSLLVMFTIGYLVSSFISGRLLALMSVGTLLSLSCLATGASLVGYAIAPAWSMIVALAVVAGLGAGAIDAGLNTFAATEFSTRMVNWLHACYGVGAASGPILMTSVLSAHHQWQRGYAIVGAGQLGLSFCFLMTRRWWPGVSKKGASHGKITRASNIATLKLPAVWLSITFFFVYTGIEAAAGAWAYSLFTESRGLSMMTAGLSVSIYWGGLTAGRLLSGFIAGYVPVFRMLRLCLLGIALGAALVWTGGASLLSLIGLAMMGFACAPVFPTMISTTPMRLGRSHTANAIGFQIAAAVLGQSLLPALIGLMARRLGLEIIGPSLLISAAALVGLHFLLTAERSSAAGELPEAAR